MAIVRIGLGVIIAKDVFAQWYHRDGTLLMMATAPNAESVSTESSRRNIANPLSSNRKVFDDIYNNFEIMTSHTKMAVRSLHVGGVSVDIRALQMKVSYFPFRLLPTACYNQLERLLIELDPRGAPLRAEISTNDRATL